MTPCGFARRVSGAADPPRAPPGVPPPSAWVQPGCFLPCPWEPKRHHYRALTPRVLNSERAWQDRPPVTVLVSVQGSHKVRLVFHKMALVALIVSNCIQNNFVTL